MVQQVPPKSLDKALAYVRDDDHTLFVATRLRVTTITAKTLKRWEKAGEWLLKEEGDGYRMREGKGSVYLFPGQLHIC